jgi:class 3 adenylate cyclase
VCWTWRCCAWPCPRSGPTCRPQPSTCRRSRTSAHPLGATILGSVLNSGYTRGSRSTLEAIVMVVDVAGDKVSRRRSLPLSLPTRVVDTAVVVALGLLYAGYVTGTVLALHGWQPHLVAVAAGAPTVLAFCWRRRHPLVVLAIACAAATFAAPVATVPVLVALYTAAAGLPVWRSLLAWSATAAACMMVGSAVATGSFGFPHVISQIVSAVTSAGMALALGLYVGIRRRYLARLHERALFARALASFLPPEVAELVEASPSALSLQGELEVTVLFSDIRGFSAFAEQVPPRRVAEVVRRHLAAMATVVRAHGGMLDKFAGDAVMAVFGAPRPVADHPARALRCAVAMQRRQAELNAEARALGLPASHIGIGVNTGAVVAGLVGGEGRVDYTVIGDAVNVAQRLQAEAKAGEILASAATIQRCAWPGAEATGARLLKGRQQPVQVYRLRWKQREAGQACGD